MRRTAHSRESVITRASRSTASLPSRALFPFVVIAPTILVYANSFNGVFLFDDAPHIVHNERIQHLRPLAGLLSGQRPIIDLSLAINYALGKLNVWGYHAINLGIHLLAALALYGVIRRTLSRNQLADRFGSSSGPLAAVAALIWAVHPLQTQSVTYIIQRSESLMGLFYLLALYCLIRSVDSVRRRVWQLAAVACCASGMGSKAVMVTAPLVLFLYDWVFLSKSAAIAARRRWTLYLGLAATWGVPWLTGVAGGVLNPSTRGASVGFGFKGIMPLDYFLTQFGVIVH